MLNTYQNIKTTYEKAFEQADTLLFVSKRNIPDAQNKQAYQKRILKNIFE